MCPANIQSRGELEIVVTSPNVLEVDAAVADQPPPGPAICTLFQTLKQSASKTKAMPS